MDGTKYDFIQSVVVNIYEHSHHWQGMSCYSALIRMKRANMTEAHEGRTGASEIYIRICSLPDFRYPSEALDR